MKVKQSKSESDFSVRLAAPAKRALSGAGISGFKQLAKLTEDEVKQLHGIGPNALKQLTQALKDKGLSFAKTKT